jgi:hypothetical protein
LAVAFIQFDADVGDALSTFGESREEALANMSGQELRSCVGYGQQAAIIAGENPTPVAVRGGYFATIVLDANLRMILRQQKVMVQPGGNFQQLGADHQEVDDEVIFVERAADFDRDAVVMAVKTFAKSAKRNEVRRAEDVFGFRDADVI